MLTMLPQLRHVKLENPRINCPTGGSSGTAGRNKTMLPGRYEGRQRSKVGSRLRAPESQVRSPHPPNS